ncbi:MAG TPA: TonB-dependent receptor [Burkholderiaceae bacterium]|nr:TonB-dependent receptor [Burkholderiaceae bacterium]
MTARRGARAPALAVIVGWAWLATGAAQAQPPADGLPTVVVTGSRRQGDGFQLPHAYGSVAAEELREAGPLVNLSEALVRVPGLTVANRHNYAQDLQISSRGFGARAGFGVRGLRLYADGIPASMPDGQGQVGHFDLASAERVEVLRGPFSALYGPNSGGVIAVHTAAVRAPQAEAAADAGRFGLRQLRAGLGVPLGGNAEHGAPGWVRLSASRFETDGFRPHSQAQRDLLQARLGWASGLDRWTVTLSHHRQEADDPLGLTPAQFAQDPRQTAAQAGEFDTRKAVEQQQAGLAWRRQLRLGPWREAALTSYAGTRQVRQYLAIPPGPQAHPAHGGGVVDFERRYGGLDARLTGAWDRAVLVAGAAVEVQHDDRRGYENHVDGPSGRRFGTQGALRREEINRARSRDVYAQLDWTLAPAWTLTAGLRTGEVELSSSDRYLANGDDSGRSRFRYANPALSLRWEASPSLAWHIAAGRGFESPTLNEIAYRPDGRTGFNEDLDPQRSRQIELGAKWRGERLSWDGAVFWIGTDDEIAVASNTGGRSSFRNIGRTRRYGAEWSGAWRPSPRWQWRWALTWLHATYADDFLACAGTPCSAPSVPVGSGGRIAGTQRAQAWAQVAWRPSALPGTWALEWRAASRTAVDDRNSVFAPGYGIWAARWTHRIPLGEGRDLEWLARVDNLADRSYVGSVIVNEGNGRYFEPGAPRAALVGLRLRQRW